MHRRARRGRRPGLSVGRDGEEGPGLPGLGTRKMLAADSREKQRERERGERERERETWRSRVKPGSVTGSLHGIWLPACKGMRTRKFQRLRIFLDAVMQLDSANVRWRRDQQQALTLSSCFPEANFPGSPVSQLLSEPPVSPDSLGWRGPRRTPQNHAKPPTQTDHTRVFPTQRTATCCAAAATLQANLRCKPVASGTALYRCPSCAKSATRIFYPFLNTVIPAAYSIQHTD